MDYSKEVNEKSPDDEVPLAEPNPSDKWLNPKMTTNEAYFALLRVWVQQSQISHNVMQCFPYYLMANYPQMFYPGYNGTTNGMGTAQAIQPTVQQPAAPAAPNRFNRFRHEEFFDNAQRQEEIINRNGGYEFVIAPLWKRFVAELIDIGILFAIKLLITFTIVDLFDLNLGVDFDFDAIRTSLEDDYSEFLSLTSELLFIEIITKIAVCFYEAMWTFSGQNVVGGATPGKMMMGIRIIHVDAVVPLELPIGVNQPMRAFLFPASNPGFKRALCRAAAKNLLMALLFPMCFVMFFFRHNRTGYDIMTKTIVVEENLAPILRRT